MEDRTCSVEGCDKKLKGRGWCSMHYLRWQKFGEPGAAEPMIRPRGPAVCAIDGCDDPARARGWCSTHYQRLARHGDPTKVVHIRGDDEARFWSKVDKNGPVSSRRPDLGPCWLWTGTVSEHGYGRFPAGAVEIPAHRWIWELKRWPIPDGYEPDHLCKTTGCVNYESHLQIVTQRENILRSDNPMAVNARKTHCIHGHEFNLVNTKWTIGPNGARWRSCRPCAREGARRWRKRMRVLKQGAQAA